MLRRKFLITIPLFSGFTLANAKKLRTRKSLIVHHVLFWLKNPGSEDDRIKLIELLRPLKKIEYHRTLIGVPVKSLGSEGVDFTYDVSLVTYFNNDKGRIAYENHPEHRAFIRDNNHLWQKRLTYDTVCEIP